MNESIHIKLNSGARSILKVGFLIRASFVLIFVIGSALAGINFLNDSFVTACICFIVSVVLFIIFYKILNAAFYKEHLMVSKESITVIRKYLGNVEKQIFNLNSRISTPYP